MENLKEIIKDFVKQSHKEMALMIDGEWGVGKTYFLKHLNPKEFGKEKIIFVSLKGVKTPEDIGRKVLASMWNIGKKFKLFSEITKNALQIGTHGLISVSLTDLVSIGFDWKKLSNFIIIFDDFERISFEHISYHDVLFEIHSAFVEDKNASVIIVANESEIFVNLSRDAQSAEDKGQNFDKTKYIQAKEKTIKRTIKFSQKLQQMFPEYIKARYCEKPAEILQYLSNSDTIKDILNREDHRNLRNYNRFFDLFVHVYENVMTLSFKRSYKNEFLNEILICLRNSVLYSLIYTDEVPALETFYLPRGYVRIEMFPSIKTFVDQGFLNLEMLKKDLERRIGVYKFDSSVSGDFATIRNWVKLPRQKTLKSFARIIKKSNKFTTYDLFLETMRYLSWFFNSEMIDEDLYKQYKNLLLKNFKKHLLQQEDINLTISGMSTEREFIDVLNECKEIKTQEKLGQYERALFTKNKLLDDAEFVEFVRKNPTLVLTMYTKNASKVAKVKKLYIHTKFLLSCLKHSPALALIKPSPWIEFASKIIDYLDDPTSAAVAQMILDEVITKSAPPYTELNEKLKRRKEMLLKRDDTKQK